MSPTAPARHRAIRSRGVILGCLLGATVATGCARVSNSALNPLKWFGRGAEVRVAADAITRTDTRPLVPEIVALQVDPTPGGAVVSAVGLPPLQGHWDAALIREPDAAPGVIAYSFRAVPPPLVTRVSTPRSRKLTAGAHLTRQDLAGIREIRVSAATNARAVRR